MLSIAFVELFKVLVISDYAFFDTALSNRTLFDFERCASAIKKMSTGGQNTIFNNVQTHMPSYFVYILLVEFSASGGIRTSM